MNSKVLLVSIFNETYKVVSSYEDQERILKIAHLLDHKMFELSKRFPKYNSNRIAILAALNLVDEIFKLRLDQEKTIEKVKKLNEFINNSYPELFC